MKEFNDFFGDQLAIFPFSIQILSKNVNSVFLSEMLNFAMLSVFHPKHFVQSLRISQVVLLCLTEALDDGTTDLTDCLSVHKTLVNRSMSSSALTDTAASHLSHNSGRTGLSSFYVPANTV